MRDCCKAAFYSFAPPLYREFLKTLSVIDVWREVALFRQTLNTSDLNQTRLKQF